MATKIHITHSFISDKWLDRSSLDNLVVVRFEDLEERTVVTEGGN